MGMLTSEAFSRSAECADDAVSLLTNDCAGGALVIGGRICGRHVVFGTACRAFWSHLKAFERV